MKNVMNMIKVTMLAVTLSATLFANSAFAANSTPLKIVQIRPHIGGNAYVSFSSKWCNNTVFSITTKTPEGRAVYAAALAAYLTGHNIKIDVPGDCSTWGAPVNSIFVL